jgi:hypothetical protein
MEEKLRMALAQAISSKRTDCTTSAGNVDMPHSDCVESLTERLSRTADTR